ncbi:MAG: hypothetical protein QE271_14145 [Bacteriovoracaceae bacterium]|nr:hypothetical protein [Bacteriovoracaceae bacterium]
MKKLTICWKSQIFFLLVMVLTIPGACQLAAARTLTQKFALTYHERTTEFFIHYLEQDQAFADKVIKVAKEDFSKLHEYFDYIPRANIHFTVNQMANSANGSALVFPYNMINLINFPPFGDSSLMGTQDWVRVLVVHEYTHILTIEMTHGWMQVFRSIFGSTAKWAGINPRWFLEGIAVWAESKITSEGRINDPRIKQSLINYFKRKNKCTSFSCMDFPNIYPYGGLAYWFGGLFLDYAEQKHPGLLSCWAKQNSESLPLFIDKRYKFCTSENIFKDYYSFIDSLEDDLTNDHFSNENRSQDLFAGNFQGKIWRAWVSDEGNKGRQAEQVTARKVWIHKLKDKKSFSRAFPYPVEQIYSSSDDKGNEEVFVGLYWEGFTTGVREFYQWDQKREWQKISTDGCQLKSGEVTQRQLVRFYPLKNQKIFCWFFQAGKHVLVVKDNKAEAAPDKMEIINTPNPLFDVSFHSQKQEFSYFMSPSFVTTPNKNRTRMVSNLNSGASANHLAEIKKSAVPLNPESVQTYWPVKYFGVDYLFLQYFSGGNMDSLMATTHMQDPMQRHRLDLTAIYNTNTGNHNHWSGGAIYNIESMPWADFGGVVGYNKFIARFSENSEEFNIRESVFAGPTWTKRGDKWMYMAQGLVNKEDQNDLLYARKINGFVIDQRVVYKNFEIGAFWQLADWQVAAIQQRADFNGESYYGYRLRQEWQWRLSEDNYISHQVHHARLITPSGTAREGAFYGGGVPNFFFGTISFPSYVVAPSGIFGRELTSAMVQHQYRFWYKNPSNGLSSFTVRSMEWFWGLEYLQSDWVVLENRIGRNPEIESWHAGLAFNTSVFYLLPIKFSFAYAKPFNYSAIEGGLNLYLGVDVRF